MSDQERIQALEAKVIELGLTISQQKVEIAHLELQSEREGNTWEELHEQLHEAHLALDQCRKDKEIEHTARREAEAKIVGLSVNNARLEIESLSAQSDSSRAAELMAAEHANSIRHQAYTSTMKKLVGDMDAMLAHLEWGGVNKGESTSWCVVCKTNGQHPHQQDCKLVELRLRVKQALDPLLGTLPHDTIRAGEP